MVTNHATLVHLLKHSSVKLTDRQTHLVEKLMSYANLMRILYIKGILIIDDDPVSRHPDFLPVDNLYKPDDSLWWDGNLLDIIYNGNDHALLTITILKALNIKNEFPV